MENKEKELKEFDQTVACMFFSEWLDAMEGLETEADKNSAAYMFVKSIVCYSLFGEEPDFERYPANRAFRLFWPMTTSRIDSSVNNRKRGFKDTGGPTEKGKKVIEAYRKNPQASMREIARITGVSKSEVDRVKRKYLSDSAVPVSGDTSVVGADVSGIPIVSVDISSSIGTGHGTGRDTGQSELPVHSGELGAVDFNSPEIKRLYSRELSHWGQITPHGGAAYEILSHYLSTHTETPMEKKFGDRYGRYILGWDTEKQEPIIGYRFGYVPPELLKHNIADVPADYSSPFWWIEAGISPVCGDKMIIPGLPADDEKDDLPDDDAPTYDDRLPF